MVYGTAADVVDWIGLGIDVILAVTLLLIVIWIFRTLR